MLRFTGTAPGAAWQQINVPPGSGTGFGVFGMDRTTPARLFVSVITPTGPRMFRSTNSGTTWTADLTLDGLMTGGGTFRARTLRGPTNFTGFNGYAQPTLAAFDPNDTNTLLAAAADAGLFISRNGGASWSTLTNNSGGPANPVVPRPWFSYFDREQCNANIFLGTQGRGVWRVSYSLADPQKMMQCQEICDEFRDDCMKDAGTPGKPTKAQCLQGFNTCLNKCKAQCQK